MKYERDTPAGRAMRRILEFMLCELESNCHEVVLVPSDQSIHAAQKLRAVQSHNAAWYRKFNQEYVSIRGRGRKTYKRPRTFITRTATSKALRRMIAGDFRGLYADRLVSFVERFRDRRRCKRKRHNDRQDLTDMPF